MGNNLISFSRVKTEKAWNIDSRQEKHGWHSVFKSKARPGTAYYLNGKPVALPPRGLEMTVKENRILFAHSELRRVHRSRVSRTSRPIGTRIGTALMAVSHLWATAASASRKLGLPLPHERFDLRNFPGTPDDNHWSPLSVNA